MTPQGIIAILGLVAEIISRKCANPTKRQVKPMTPQTILAVIGLAVKIISIATDD